MLSIGEDVLSSIDVVGTTSMTKDRRKRLHKRKWRR
jgi:hypothetical protein